MKTNAQKKKPKVIVIIPAYNCAPQIKRVLAGFDKKLLSRVAEVIVVNNRSSDNTVSEAKKAINNIDSTKLRVCTNIENVSLGGSHKVGFYYGKSVKADYVAILHGDDQASTNELNILLDEIIKNPSLDAVLGSRFMKESILKGYSWKRIMGNKVLNFIYTIVMLRKTYDLGSGLNIFKLSALESNEIINFDNINWHHFDHMIYQFYLILYHNFTILNITDLINWNHSLEGYNTSDINILYKLKNNKYGFSWIDPYMI